MIKGILTLLIIVLTVFVYSATEDIMTTAIVFIVSMLMRGILNTLINFFLFAAVVLVVLYLINEDAQKWIDNILTGLS